MSAFSGADEVTIGTLTIRVAGMDVHAAAGPPRHARGIFAGDLGTDLPLPLDDADMNVADEVWDVTVTERSDLLNDRGFLAVAPQLEVFTLPTPPEHGQALLIESPSGKLQWAFPDQHRTVAEADGPERTRYVVPLPFAGTTASSLRGLRLSFGTLIARAIRVLTFPLRKVAGGLVARAITHWEEKNRPYQLWHYPNGRTPVPVEADSFPLLTPGPALLLLHGAFSTCAAGFGEFLDHHDDLAVFRDRYSERVFSFDHPTMSDDPATNAAAFLDRFPARPLELDILCHSRGGLVARVLAEGHSSVPELDLADVQVSKVVFVGTPNRGTPLADTDRMGDFASVFTNLLRVLPTGAGLAGVLEFVKDVATNAVGHLPGLLALAPAREGDPDGFIARLNGGANQSEPAKYAAVAANFEPRAGIPLWLADLAADVGIGVANDLVVPTDGVHASNCDSAFPIVDPHLLGPDEEIHHLCYFRQAPVAQYVLGLLLTTARAAAAPSAG